MLEGAKRINPLMPEVDFARDEVPNLHELLAELREHGPVVPVAYHGGEAWLVVGNAELRKAFMDERHFAAQASYSVIAEPAIGRTIQVMSGREHRRIRGLVTDPLLPQQVRRQTESLIDPVINELLDGVENKHEVDLVQAFTKPMPFRIITRLLGIPVEDEGMMLEWAMKLFDFPWDPEGAKKAKEEFGGYLQDVLDQRRNQPEDDIISLLIQSEYEGEHLSDEEIISFCRLLFPAGSDTTFKGGGSLIYEVLTRPEVRGQVLEGEEQRRAIILEGLRLHTPTALLPRRCSKDTELGGVQIKQGDWMLFGIIAANRDPSVFDEPEQFDIQRDQRPTLTFGRGIHFCLGTHLAQLELSRALVHIFERFPNMCLAPDKEVEIVGGILRGPKELWVYPNGEGS